MTEMIRKLVPIEVKDLGERTLRFVGSTEAEDRDGEVIQAKGWQLRHFRKNPVFMWAHMYSQPPIGRAKKVGVEEGKLIFDIEFADRETYPFADTIYRLYKGKFLHATSVGFIPDQDAIVYGDGEKAPRRTFTKQELLELSAVPVPSNPEALIQAREAGLITIKEFEQITKPEETDQYFRVPAPGQAGKHDGHRIRTIDISKEKGIKALYCGEDKVIITYLFSKDDKYGWTMESARAWVRENAEKHVVLEADSEEYSASFNQDFFLDTNDCPEAKYPGPKETSQAEMGDAFDYAKSLIAAGDLNEENIELAWDMVRAILRLTGSDIPVDILAVLGVEPEENAGDTTQPDQESVDLLSIATQRVLEGLQVG